MRNTSGILLTMAAVALGSLGAAAFAMADPIGLVGPIAPVLGAGGFLIQVPAAAADEWQGPMEVAPGPATTDAGPGYYVICTTRTQRTRYDDVNVCD